MIWIKQACLCKNINFIDSNSIKKSLNNINMLSRQRKRKISSNGYNKVTKTYDQASINTRFINKSEIHNA